MMQPSARLTMYKTNADLHIDYKMLVSFVTSYSSGMGQYIGTCTYVSTLKYMFLSTYTCT